MKLTATLLVAGCLLLGCSGQDATAEPAAADVGADMAPATEGDRDPQGIALKPPSADGVLYLIYRRDGNGAVSYEVENGATVSYWFGHAFDFKGGRYFTGFASKTNDRDGDDRDSEYAMEDGRVAISQATLRTSGADAVEWALVDTDGYVGEFGRDDRAEERDASREALAHETADGRLLLAVPTRTSEAGAATRGYALLLFDPDNVDALPFRSWGYVGSVAADTLAFAPEADAGLPRLQATRQGAAATLAFDPERARYVP